MKRYLCIGFLSFLSAITGSAGMVDLVNGVKVGALLPANSPQYLTAAPAPGAALTLIDFWATWCKPCQEALPKLNALYRKYSSRGLVVIGLSAETKEVVQRFTAKGTMDYPVAVEQPPGLYAALKIKALPYCIFVGRDGRIVWRGQPEEITDALVEKLLGTKR